MFFITKHIDEPLCLRTNVLYSYVTITDLRCGIMCHWNLNAIAARNFSKINLLKAYFTIRKADIAYLSETYLDSSFLVNYENLVIQGYNLVSCDHPTDSKRGGVYLLQRLLPVENN